MASSFAVEKNLVGVGVILSWGTFPGIALDDALEKANKQLNGPLPFIEQ